MNGMADGDYFVSQAMMASSSVGVFMMTIVANAIPIKRRTISKIRNTLTVFRKKTSSSRKSSNNGYKFIVKFSAK